jgi:hypothetical protein
VNRLLPFLARLVVVSLLFVPFLTPLRTGYTTALKFVATAALPAGFVLDNLRYDSFNNLYTCLVLILSTPGLKLPRRLTGVVTGVGLFLAIDLFMAVVWPLYLKTPRPSLANMAVSYGWLVTAHYLLPFLLWFVFAFREIDRLFRGASPGETRPAGAA